MSGQRRVGEIASGPATLWLVAILALTAAVYVPSLRNTFTNWDDDKYVVNNAAIRSLAPDAIARQFTTILEGNYHPLTMLSLSVDYAIGRLDPTGYHVTNLVLHLLNTALVFWLSLLLVQRWSSSSGGHDARLVAVVAALLFGVHPMHVESVVWVAERKDVLYAAFFLSSLICYVKYVGNGRAAFFVWAVLLFVGAVLSKATAVTLAVTLFAIDYLSARKPVAGLFLEKAPFVLLALVFGVVAAVAQKSQGAVLADTYLALHERVLVACHGFVSYLSKLLLPFDLSPFYAYPSRVGGRWPMSYWVAPVGVGLVAAGIGLARRHRLIVFCALFFAINVALVLQFFPVGSAVMADRYVYVASIGCFLAAGVAFDKLLRRSNYRRVAAAVLGAYTMFLCVTTYRYSQTWKDSLTLWNAVIDRDPASPLPYYNRGSARLELGDSSGAVRDLSRAVEFNPRYAEAYHNRGVARRSLQDFEGAVADFSRALAINPRYRDAYLNLGNLMVTLGRFSDADAAYTRLIQLGGDAGSLASVHLKRAIARYLAGEYAGAIDDLATVGETDLAGVRDTFAGFADLDSRNNRAACGAWQTAADRGVAVAREYASRYCR